MASVWPVGLLLTAFYSIVNKKWSNGTCAFKIRHTAELYSYMVRPAQNDRRLKMIISKFPSNSPNIYYYYYYYISPPPILKLMELTDLFPFFFFLQ